MALNNLELTYNQKYFTPEQFKELISILAPKNIVSLSTIPQLKENKLLFDKFYTSIPDLQKSHERKVLGKILKSIRQTKNDNCLPAFAYRLGKDRYEIIYSPEKY